MKKILILMVLLSKIIFASEIYKLTEKMVFVKSKWYGNKDISKWCVDGYVWIEYRNNKRGSMSQKFYEDDKKRTRPEKCPKK